MAGTFVINETDDWLPASWVFDNAMEEMARHIALDNSELAQELLDARTSTSMGYFDLRQRDSLSVMLIHKAAKHSLQLIRDQGAGAFARPEFFPGYVSQLEKLCNLLERDPRLHE